MSDITAKIISIEPESPEAEKTIDALVKTDTGAAVLSSSIHALPQHSEANTTKFTWMAVLLSLFWVAIIIVGVIHTYGAEAIPSGISMLGWGGIAALISLPIAIIFICSFALKQLAFMSQNTQILTQAADAISRPDEQVKARAASLAGAVRSQVLSVDGSLNTALERLASMEVILKNHTDALDGSHIAATRQTGDIAQRLSEERDALKTISNNFDERMNALSRMLSEHSERLAQSTHIAEQKIQEARVSVEGAAAKINASSEIVRENALQASQTLSESQSSISDLAGTIKAETSTLDVLNARHATEMGELIEQLRQEQQELSVSIEARLDKMRDMALSAKVSAESLTDASEAGRKTVEALAASASLADNAVKQRFADMEDMVRYSNEKAESISERAAKRVRDSLSLTRMEISRIEDDMRVLESNIDTRTRQTTLDVTPTKTGWRKSLLRFRPIEIEPETTPEIEIEDVASISEPSPVSAPSPAPEIPPALTAAPKQEHSEPVTTLAPDDGPTLHIEPVTDEDISITNANADITNFNPADRITPVEPQLRTTRKPQRGWSWKNMLGGLKADEAVSSMQDTLPATSPVPDLGQQASTVIAHLKELGLAPNAVVDDGSIIEAVNTRKSKGAQAMREVVTLRLPDVTRHLGKAMGSNASLSADVQSFSSTYHRALSAYENDREGLRAQLETECGRAYLICDSALNQI